MLLDLQTNLILEKWLPSVEPMHLIIQSSLEGNGQSSLPKRKHLIEANNQDLIFWHVGNLQRLQHLIQMITWFRINAEQSASALLETPS